MSAAASPTPSKPERAPRATAREWTFRILCLFAVPSVLLLCLEGGLRLAGFGRSLRFLVPDDAPGMMRTNPDFAASLLPGGFDLRPLNIRVPVHKAPNQVRIVVLGESAAQGIPVPSFAFAAQLREQLRSRYPGREFEVINTGIVAVNSHVVYQVTRELAGYEPDLFVVYMGNNEVVGPYGPGCAYLSVMPPLWVIRLSVFVRSTRTGQLATAILGRLAPRGSVPEQWGGMAMFAGSTVAGDDPRLRGVHRNFEANLRDIVRVASGAGARVLLCTVASNISDSAPFVSLHRPGMAEPDLERWRAAFERGRIEWLLGEDEAARGDLDEALRIDPQYADTSFLLGALDLQASRVEDARRHLFDAEHWDALRFRPDPRINEIIRQVARENPARAVLLDAAMIMGSDPASGARPAGRGLFFEHVHFDWDGNYLIARAMAEGAGKALFPGGDGAGSWLDSPGCAAALGYTAHGRLDVLEKIATIEQNAPFTNQVTYPEDQARLAGELAQAKLDFEDRAKTRSAREVVASAIARDPTNPDLPKILEGIDDDLGDLEAALADSRRSQELQPRNFALASDEAIKLARLGRFGEAESLLARISKGCPPRDLALMAPVFADFYVRTKRFDEGRRRLEGIIALRPSDVSVRLTLGRLLRFAGDDKEAERAIRSALAVDPGNRGAFEALASLLHDQGRESEVEKEGYAAAERQPGNMANNLRLAVVSSSKGDPGQAIRFLLLAERCGPVSADMEMYLAMNLLKQKRLDEALVHVGEARRISRYEGNPQLTEKINMAIERIRSQMR